MEPVGGHEEGTPWRSSSQAGLEQGSPSRGAVQILPSLGAVPDGLPALDTPQVGGRLAR